MPETPAAPYLRVKQHLKDGLARGRWAPGAQLPSEAQLVARFGVSRMTVGRALRELQAEGWVSRVQGVGSFAAPLHKVASTLTLRDVHEEIESRGHRHTVQLHEAAAQPATPDVAAQLGLAEGAPVFHVSLTHLEDGRPMQLERRWVNPQAVPDFLAHDFTAVTPTQVLFARTVLRRAQYAIEAAAATPDEAALLGIEPGAACLVVSRRTEAQDTAITIARLVHPGSRYLLQGEFAP